METKIGMSIYQDTQVYMISLILLLVCNMLAQHMEEMEFGLDGKGMQGLVTMEIKP